jgi:SAM-dependent methyltransferase
MNPEEPTKLIIKLTMTKFFTSDQNNYFSQSCIKRFRWQTENAFVSQAERELLSNLPIVLGSKVLELGCGTGSNLYNLRVINQDFEFTGVDINSEEIELAKQKFPDAQFFIGDAINTHFPDESFDMVFCRDVIHHISISEQVKLIEEMTRLAKVNGKVVVIESNALNFVVWTFGKLVKAEQYLVKSTPRYIVSLIEQVETLNTSNLNVKFVEPWNFFRFILHYSFGLPQLAKSKFFCKLLRQINRLFYNIVPSDTWAYMIFEMTKNIKGHKKTSDNL